MPYGTITNNALYGRMIFTDDARWVFLPDRAPAMPFGTRVHFAEVGWGATAPPPGIRRAMFVTATAAAAPAPTATATAAATAST